MEITELKYNWDLLGEKDPMWAILSDPNMKGGKWNEDDFFATGVRDIATFLETSRALDVCIPRGSALDFGCGIGRLTQALAEHFNSVVGSDVSESMIRRAEELNRHSDKCQYRLNTEPHLDCFDDGAFDFCITFLVLQHMKTEYAMAYIAEFCRVLRPEGVLLFQIPTTCKVPGAPPPPPDVPGVPPRRSPEGIIEMYATPLHDVVRLLDDNGLDVIAVRSDGRAGPEFLSHEIWALKGG